MQFPCPHKLMVEPVVLGGITCYRHVDEDDDVYCTVMNNFSTRAQEISVMHMQGIHYNHEVTQMMRVVFLSSSEARWQWYVALSQAKGDMLKSMLVGTSTLLTAMPQLKDALVDELYRTFGQIIIANLYEACKYQIMTPSGASIDEPNAPKLQMQSLVQLNVVEAALEIESRNRSRADRMRDTVNALYKKK